MSTPQRVLVVAALAVLIPLVPFLAVGELPGERWLSAVDANAAAFGATGAAFLAADVLAPVPSSLVGTMLGARLGLLPGFAWAFGGLMLGSLIGYAAGRGLFARFAARSAPAPTLIAVLLSRPVPVLAEATSIAAGGTRVALGPFCAVSMAGNAVYAAALAGNGATLVPSGLLGPGLVLPLLLPVVAWFIWRRAHRPTDRATEPR